MRRSRNLVSPLRISVEAIWETRPHIKHVHGTCTSHQNPKTSKFPDITLNRGGNTRREWLYGANSAVLKRNMLSG